MDFWGRWYLAESWVLFWQGHSGQKNHMHFFRSDSHASQLNSGSFLLRDSVHINSLSWTVWPWPSTVVRMGESKLCDSLWLPQDQWTEPWCSLGRDYKQFLQVCVFTVCSFTWLCHHAPRNNLQWVWAQHLAWNNKTQWDLLLLWGPDFYQKQDLIGTRSAEQVHCIFQVYWIPWRLGKWRNHSLFLVKRTPSNTYWMLTRGQALSKPLTVLAHQTLWSWDSHYPHSVHKETGIWRG